MNRPASTAATRPAEFDHATKTARSMHGMIQVARLQLNVVEDDYRQLVFGEIGRTSLKGASVGELGKVIDALKRKGFKPLPKGRGGKKGVAEHAVAGKARALWISLYHLNVVHNRDEEALEAFAKRQTGCDRMVWMKQSDGYQLIEALKDMGRRNGWRMAHIGTHKPYDVIELQGSLCHAILAKLKAAGVAPADWGLHDAAWKLCGIENAKESRWVAEDYQRLAAGLGAKLREFGTGGAA